MNGVSYDTFRLYEAIENKCIPLICREEGDDEYYNWLHSHLPGLFAASNWNEINAFIEIISQNKDICQAYCNTIYDQWTKWKESIRLECSRVIENR